MAGERAKKLAAEQKAAAKADKLRRKNSDNPEDWGRMKQMVKSFSMTREYDDKLIWLMLGALLGVIAIFVVLSFFLNPFWMYLVFGVAFGVISAMYVLTWRAKGATFRRFAGQPGAAEVAINLLPKKGWVKNPAIAIDRHQNSVHRVIGPPGIVLVGDGQPGRVREMLATEAKRHEAIKYSVPVTTVLMGDAANQVPMSKLDKYIKKLPKAIKDTQITEVVSRLKALDGSRPRVPMPKGPMPNMKGARAALRGR